MSGEMQVNKFETGGRQCAKEVNCMRSLDQTLQATGLVRAWWGPRRLMITEMAPPLPVFLWIVIEPLQCQTKWEWHQKSRSIMPVKRVIPTRLDYNSVWLADKSQFHGKKGFTHVSKWVIQWQTQLEYKKGDSIDPLSVIEYTWFKSHATIILFAKVQQCRWPHVSRKEQQLQD